MSKHNNHNRDHYMQAGRDRQSDKRLQDFDKQALGQTEHNLKAGSRNFIPGAAPVGQKKEENE